MADEQDGEWLATPAGADDGRLLSPTELQNQRRLDPVVTGGDD